MCIRDSVQADQVGVGGQRFGLGADRRRLGVAAHADAVGLGGELLAARVGFGLGLDHLDLGAVSYTHLCSR